MSIQQKHTPLELLFIVFSHMGIISINKIFLHWLISGKSGIVGNRFAASLSSIGIPSHFVHATEWSHGDLGLFHKTIKKLN